MLQLLAGEDATGLESMSIWYFARKILSGQHLLIYIREIRDAQHETGQGVIDVERKRERSSSCVHIRPAERF